MEPQTSNSSGYNLRAIEIKYFEKVNGSVNQSFYKGIEQSLALLQWGFNNVALWQLFDESLSDSDLRNYGCKTWSYIHSLLNLPIEYTPIKVIGEELETAHFQVIQADWLNNLRPIPLLDIDSSGFRIKYTHDNPLLNWRELNERFTVRVGHRYFLLPGLNRLGKEVDMLRQFLLEWLPEQEPVKASQV